MDSEKSPSTAGPCDQAEGEVREIRMAGSTDLEHLHELGYEQNLQRSRSLLTLLFQSLAIVAIPYAFGSPLISAIYGGGQLPMFLGWIVVLILSEAVAMSLGELASRYPTSAGPYYWTFQLASPKTRTFLSFVTGWTWLIGNWTITLSVNFGFASLIAACVALYHPDYVISDWELLLIFYAMCLITFVIVAFGNKMLPLIDTICVTFTILAMVATLICVLVRADAGRNPAAVTFAPLGMLTTMAEECADPAVTVPRAMSLCILPICATMPALDDILGAPVGQALPYIYGRVAGSPGGGLGLTFSVLVVSLFCSISITVATSRCTWAFARDKAIPLSSLWARIDERHGSPIWALVLTTIVQMLLGLISLGSSSAFLAFVSVSVIAIAVSYAVPLVISMACFRKEVAVARWKMGKLLGWCVNIVAMAWIVFEVVLFSMPGTIPVTTTSMNYAIAVYVGLLLLSSLWYFVHARTVIDSV
ncbi:Amino acid/polyamine transporter I [Niveomyces insectorum RCEF 264]|uniref:Amino acid/polyamine transporter I n=1 Tax=Niveomyces insectorum RCEF 264 TaxID=1081102 RepID=A0A167YU44_9HYPO|nr:Amino acid/polyamine transporter I [Niveomyces insectorum RCEF 264]